jgi:lysophospholipase L1-like esterase
MDARRTLQLFALLWFMGFAAALAFEPPHFRPFELLRTEGPVFRPGQRVEMDAYGALAYRYPGVVGPAVRPNTFTTDRSGLRNPPMGWPRVVVVGDSFVAGVGLSDDETLPQVLSRRLGEPVYNYGAQLQYGPRHYLGDPRFSQQAPGVVVVMPSESALAPLDLPPSAGGSGAVGGDGRRHVRLGPPTPFSVWDTLANELLAVNVLLNRDNGFARWARGVYHPLRAIVLGHPNEVVVDGAPALVADLDEQRLTRPVTQANLGPLVESYAAFVRAVEARGSRVLVAPVPAMGSVYPELFPEADRARVVSPSLVQALLAALAAQGVATLDLLPAFVAHKTPYLYLRDDTHWDAPGVAVTAEAVEAALVSRGWTRTGTTAR